MTRSASQTSASTPKIDSFVPQSESLVPDDVLDLYDDDDFGEPSTAAISAPSPPRPSAGAALDIPSGVPSDVSDDGMDVAYVEEQRQQQQRWMASGMPEDVEPEEDTLEHLPAATPRSPKTARGDGQGGRQSRSVYGSVGGSIYDDEDEEDGEVGSVSIVSRTTASHNGASAGMTRTSTN